MGSLCDALLGARLITEKAREKVDERERTFIGQQLGRLKGKNAPASLMNLEEVSTVSEFKEMAKQILLNDQGATTIAEVVRLAHKINELDGGKRLIYIILSLRDNLHKVKPDKREQVIKRALRSSNPTADVPADWMM
jgi:hypothetical protein